MKMRANLFSNLARSFVLGCLITLALPVATARAAEPTVALSGNRPAEATLGSAVAHADPSRTMTMDVVLALRNRPALDQLIAEQQDPASPLYHQWLTPAQFAAQFGPTEEEFAAVSQWLTGQGFTITHSSLEPPLHSVHRHRGASRAVLRHDRDGLRQWRVLRKRHGAANPGQIRGHHRRDQGTR